MTVVRTMILNSTNPDQPDFLTWLLDQDLSIISHWPEYNGMSWQEIFDYFEANIDPTDGFIDEVVEENSSTQTTITTTFEDLSSFPDFKEKYVDGVGLLSCNANSNTITGTPYTVWLSNVQPWDEVVAITNNVSTPKESTLVGWVKTVDNDDLITLQHDCLITANKVRYVIIRPPSVKNYLTWLYEKEYGITKSTSFSEV